MLLCRDWSSARLVAGAGLAGLSQAPHTALGCLSNLLVSEMIDSHDHVLVSERFLSEEMVPLG